MKPEIRDAQRLHLDQLSALALRSKGYWGYAPALLAAMREELTWTVADLELMHFRVALLAEEIAGFSAVAPLGDGRAELEALFVDPACIGQGIGRVLMDDATAVARSAGYRLLIIQSDPHAERFYLACGAVRRGERPSGSIPGRLLPLLELPLTE